MASQIAMDDRFIYFDRNNNNNTKRYYKADGHLVPDPMHTSGSQLSAVPPGVMQDYGPRYTYTHPTSQQQQQQPPSNRSTRKSTAELASGGLWYHQTARDLDLAFIHNQI